MCVTGTSIYDPKVYGIYNGNYLSQYGHVSMSDFLNIILYAEKSYMLFCRLICKHISK